jgi:ATP-dependent DNA helicase RecQ
MTILGLSVPEMMCLVNISKGRIEKTMALLSLESPAPVVKQGTKWQLTAGRLTDEFWSRAERLTELRRAEYRQMREYVHLPHGEHMAFLICALDGDPESAGKPALPELPGTVDPVLLQEAVKFLRRTNLPIDVRKKWPVGGMPSYAVSGVISPGLLAQPGRALCRWGDAGWGDLVRTGKYRDDHFENELVQACVEMLKEWRPEPAPCWVTSVPSHRHPNLVPDFARRLAAALHLPYYSVLARSGNRPEQKTMANSTQQARNLDGAFGLNGSELPPGPVLLIDDMVDSRWTMPVCAWLLRKNGSGEVWPMALSQAGYEQ